MTRNEVTRMVLEGARERISDPVRWTHGYAGEGPEDPVCAALAISQIVKLLRVDRVKCVKQVKDALLRVLPRSPLRRHDEKTFRTRSIIRWNDSATHAEVIAAFDRAIASLK